MHADNPRAVIGHNQPPSAIDRAKPAMEALGAVLSASPVFNTEDEVRAAKAALDNATTALNLIEIERKSLVDPLNTEVKEINGRYHQWHNADKKRPGTYDKIVGETLSRLTDYVREEERKRFEAEQAAKRAAEKAAAEAKRAAEALAEAREAAEAGVCDIDIAGAMEAADTLSQRALRDMWTHRRVEAQTKVRVTGGSRNAISLKDHETLHVTDWRAAIEDIGLTQDIAEAILKGARHYRKHNHELPRGVEASYERGL
jgi:hypothetical protein